MTGTSIVFLKGTTYLVNNLFSSLLFAVGVICLLMWVMFRSLRMLLISLVPNLIPQFITAGCMGFFDIPLKPSTILVFSIAFGITVDATIHFVSTFRREVIKHNKPIRIALDDTIAEVGLSMIYTMVAICSGFLIFTFSEFQGTAALGWLTGLTIITGMAANLFLLPALILSFEKFINPKFELKEVVIDLPEED
jgi:predicted RND superfamily exporter protein